MSYTLLHWHLHSHGSIGIHSFRRMLSVNGIGFLDLRCWKSCFERWKKTIDLEFVVHRRVHISPVARGSDSSISYSLSVIVNTLGHCQEINCNNHMAMPQSHSSLLRVKWYRDTRTRKKLSSKCLSRLSRQAWRLERHVAMRDVHQQSPKRRSVLNTRR